MIAVAILNAVTEYRMYGGIDDKCPFRAPSRPGTPSRAADTMREVLAQPMLAALRCQVRDFGESAFLRGGLPGMHRLMRQVEDRAPDAYAVELVNKWWAGVGAGHAHWLPCQASAKLGSLPLTHERPRSVDAVHALRVNLRSHYADFVHTTMVGQSPREPEPKRLGITCLTAATRGRSAI